MNEGHTDGVIKLANQNKHQLSEVNLRNCYKTL